MVLKYDRYGTPYDDGVCMSQEDIDDIIARTRTVVAFTSLRVPPSRPAPAAPAAEAKAAAEPQPRGPEQPPRPGAPRTEP